MAENRSPLFNQPRVLIIKGARPFFRFNRVDPIFLHFSKFRNVPIFYFPPTSLDKSSWFAIIVVDPRIPHRRIHSALKYLGLLFFSRFLFQHQAPYLAEINYFIWFILPLEICLIFQIKQVKR